jgi:hypothetical protein
MSSGNRAVYLVISLAALMGVIGVAMMGRG